MCGGGGGGGDGGAAAREAERQARIDAATKSVNDIFADPSRNLIYDTVRDDTRGFYSGQLEEDKEAARRQLEFAKARSGTFGGSAGIDLDTEFQKRYDRGLLDVANRADSSASGMRSSDEQSRLGIISKILAGMDQSSAITSAMNGLQTNAEVGWQNAMAGRMSNVFSDLLAMYGGTQQAAGQAAAQQQAKDQFGAYFPTNKSSNGAIVR